MKKYLIILIILFSANISNVDANGFSIRQLQIFLNSKGFTLNDDGKFGQLTREALKDYQSQNIQNGLTPNGRLDLATLKQITKDGGQPNTSGSQKSEALTGSGNGDAIGQMRGTNFCTTIGGARDRDGVKSCGTDVGDCKNLGKKPNAETVRECQTCPDCQYIKGSCGTPLYFYKGDKDNAQTVPNQKICTVALTQSKLTEVFGSNKQSAYCSKSVKVCNGKQCGNFPVRDTGHARSDTIDMQGDCFKQLGIQDDINPVSKLIVSRIQGDGQGDTKVAGNSQTKTQ